MLLSWLSALTYKQNPNLLKKAHTFLFPGIKKCPDYVQDSMMDDIKKYDVLDELKRLKIPCLILCGENDLICPVESSMKMHERLVNSMLYIFRDCGHLILYEREEYCIQIIKSWLEKVLSGEYSHNLGVRHV
jgi:pimeloyl-ACP methyl ester carboxylesterase